MRSWPARAALRSGLAMFLLGQGGCMVTTLLWHDEEVAHSKYVRAQELVGAAVDGAGVLHVAARYSDPGAWHLTSKLNERHGTFHVAERVGVVDTHPLPPTARPVRIADGRAGAAGHGGSERPGPEAPVVLAWNGVAVTVKGWGTEDERLLLPDLPADDRSGGPALWRVALTPAAVAVDIVTFPLQAVYVLFFWRGC